MSPTFGTDNPSSARRGARFVTGRLLAGRYEILELIGEGGTAEVFRARDHRLERIVALKVLRPQHGQDPEARARFAAEARSAAALAAVNIVPVYDFGTADDGSLFIVMRLIAGPSLRRVLSQNGALPAVQAIEIGRQVALALATAHDHGLIHRDVKPGNILLDAGGAAHLTDFGIVKGLSGGDDLTRTGVTFGTAAYLSPEQARGMPVGPRTDHYALGVVIYEMLAGRAPFGGDDPMTVSYRHAHDAPVPVDVVVSGLDRDLTRLVMQCLEKDPRRRPQSAHEIAMRLTSIGGANGSLGPAAALGGLAAAASDSPTVAQWHEPDKETVPLRTVPPDPVTAGWAAPVGAAAAWSADTVPTTPVGRRQPVSGPERGIAPPGRAARGSRGRRRRDGAATGMAVALLAIALIVLAFVALPMIRPEPEPGGVAAAPPTGSTLFSPAASAPAFAPPTLAPLSSASVAPVATEPPPPAVLEPTPEPATAPTPEPSPEPSPRPTPRPTPEPAQRPTPEPTPPPTPAPTLTPRPPAEDVSVRIPNRLFEGDYDGPGSGRYHGRTASWVYGQGTPYHTMTARFRLDHEGQVRPRASLEIVGLDGENPRKNRIAVVLNGVTIFEGPNPLPNDDCCGPSGPGNWGSVTFPVAGDILRRNNELSISNLEPGECTLCPNFVMVDYAELDYRVRP